MTMRTAAETVYVLLDGSLDVTAEGATVTLEALDSVRLPAGTVRRVDNVSGAPAMLLVISSTAARA